jgi:hypothetical protein
MQCTVPRITIMKSQLLPNTLWNLLVINGEVFSVFFNSVIISFILLANYAHQCYHVPCLHHRYLMSRLSLQVFYLWRHVLFTAPPFILWKWNLETLFAPLHRSSPFIGGLHCQAIQTEHGPYIAERTQKAVYNVRCFWSACTSLFIFILHVKYA